jgi:thiosulfate dehydrogenase [quinone] large subunit
MSASTDTTTSPSARPTGDSATLTAPARLVLGVLRILFGVIFLWAFLDKLFGLGRATPSESSWLNGGDPTYGYLANNEGPFSSVFTGLAGQTWVTWLFMLGLLGIGVALIAGAGVRLAAISGCAMYLMMWLSAFPLENNPFVDDHLTGAVTMVLFGLTGAGDTLGLGGWWQRTSLVRRVPLLR